MGGVDSDGLLAVRLSQVLVAFTIELDNEFEHQMPHRRSRGPAAGAQRGPWLVSQVMWTNFLRFIEQDGVALRAVEDLARMTNLDGVRRWGYVTIEPDPADRRDKPPRRDWIVRPTAVGRAAQNVWAPLPAVVEGRWRDRFGTAEIDELRDALRAVGDQIEERLPDYLPVVRADFRADIRDVPVPTAVVDSDDDLSALLSRVLLAYTLEFERDSAVSLPIVANALRILGPDGSGVRLPDLPLAAGVSVEAIAMSVGWLVRHGYAVIEGDPTATRTTATRTKVARLTAKGRSVYQDCQRRRDAADRWWRTRFGDHRTDRLRLALDQLMARTDGRSRMGEGLRPYPDGWRAHKPYLAQTTAVIGDPGTGLPHYPMVLHRGGWPDGS